MKKKRQSNRKTSSYFLYDLLEFIFPPGNKRSEQKTSKNKSNYFSYDNLSNLYKYVSGIISSLIFLIILILIIFFCITSHEKVYKTLLSIYHRIIVLFNKIHLFLIKFIKHTSDSKYPSLTVEIIFTVICLVIACLIIYAIISLLRKIYYSTFDLIDYISGANLSSWLYKGNISRGNIQHCLDRVNYYRKKYKVPLLKLDDRISAFAYRGSIELMQNHMAHKHFKDAGKSIWNYGFNGCSAENQGDSHGWPLRGDINSTIDDILKAMMDEGPGGGHHDNMVNPQYRRLGVGLILTSDKKLYFTNDFSE